jgi:hypothetical protein
MDLLSLENFYRFTHISKSTNRGEVPLLAEDLQTQDIFQEFSLKPNFAFSWMKLQFKICCSFF